MPGRIVMHWDSKVIKYAYTKTTDDRLCIVGSFPGSIQANQFFGAPLIPNSTGATMALKLTDSLQEWNIEAPKVIGMCWDTTPSNTGAIKGSAALFQEEIGKALLWLACRHHIGELHIKHPHDRVRQILQNAPTYPLFKRFREIFSTLPMEDLKLWEWPDPLMRPLTFLASRALEVREWGE